MLLNFGRDDSVYAPPFSSFGPSRAARMHKHIVARRHTKNFAFLFEVPSLLDDCGAELFPWDFQNLVDGRQRL